MRCYELVMEQETKLEQQGCEPVNEFELVTAIGFLAFARAEVEYAVLERRHKKNRNSPAPAFRRLSVQSRFAEQRCHPMNEVPFCEAAPQNTAQTPS